VKGEGEKGTVEGIEHTRAKGRKIKPTGKVFFWIKLLPCAVERGQERCKRQAWVGEEKIKTREGRRDEEAI